MHISVMASALAATVFLTGCQRPTTAPRPPERYGWDPGLTHRCVRTPHPDKDNYFEDLTDCPTTNQSWTVAVHSETTQRSYGPDNQSFLINHPDSPVSLQWRPVRDEAGAKHLGIQLTTNFETIAHPGGAGYFTWFVLMDHLAHGGGPLPRPDQLTSQVQVTYNDSTPNGATRAFVGITATWDGQTHGAEVCFVLHNWGNNDPAPDVRASIKNNALEFVTLDGAPLGITVTEGEPSLVRVNWHRIVKDLAKGGYFSPPEQGWANTQTAAVYVGTEVNNFSPTASASATLLIREFVIVNK